MLTKYKAMSHEMVKDVDRSLWVSMNAAVYLYHNHDVIRIAGSISNPIKFLRCTHNCTFIYFRIQMNSLRNVFSFKSR